MSLSRRQIAGLAAGALSVAALAAAGLAAADALDRAFPPPIEPITVSTEVVDREGLLLRAFASPQGRWRMAVELDTVDPKFLDMLIAYEDKRFRAHHGVDLLAVGRAAFQFLANGRIVSGGSTITMQLARLMEPRENRSLLAKAKQAARALQLERRLTKDEILRRYLTLAPYGGNVEGIRAAALTWFGKEPRRLTLGEAAMLVSLPQSPEQLRPDRNREAALGARDRVLQRMVDAGRLSPGEMARAIAEPIKARRTPMPAFAAHAAEEALAADPSAGRLALALSRPLQERLEAVAREAAERLGPRINVAILMADARTGEILARVGSADFLDTARAGWIDMTRVPRSPGSTLKPFIYGLAFEQGLIAQETIIEDRPADFAGYRPRNFDMRYQGDVSMRTALQLSLNVPAVRLLDTLGPARLAARFRGAGAQLHLPAGERPGLAIGLGGAGITLADLVMLYGGLADGGNAAALSMRPGTPVVRSPVLDPVAAWQVTDILAGVAPPRDAPAIGIAYKTGTSYGYRDAWSIGFDGRHVVGIWVGRPDGGAVPGLSGYETAAPILFEAFTRSGVAITPRRSAPIGALRRARDELPVTLQRFESPLEQEPGVVEAAPRIVFPPNGARVALIGEGPDGMAPLALKLQGGRAPFRWLANGRPLAEISRRRTGNWRPEGAGFSTLTVIDARGRADSVEIFVE